MVGDKTLAGVLYATAGMFILSVIFSVLAATGEGVFRQSAGQVSRQFSSILIPQGWTLIIWTVTYLWLALGIAFLITNIFRKKHLDPSIFTLPMCYTLLLNLVLQICWLFIWDSMNPVGSSMFLFFIVITNWLLLGFFSKRLLRGEWDLSRNDVWLYRALPQNGLAMYTTWTTLGSLVNFSIAIQYGRPDSEELSQIDGDLLSLCLLAILLIIWIPLENYMFFEELQYVLTPHLVLISSLGGILRNLEPIEEWDQRRTFVATLLVVSVIALMLRLVLIIYAHFRGHPFKKVTTSLLEITNLRH